MRQGCGRFKATENKLLVSMDKERRSVSVSHGYNSIEIKRGFQVLPAVNSQWPKRNGIKDVAKFMKNEHCFTDMEILNMGIMLSKIRIANYRSIENLSLDLGMINLLIGQNNAGKTNFLKALNLAISGSNDISENDIFVAREERISRTKTAIIDILLQPIDENWEVCKEFSDFWTSVFTEMWITTNVSEGNYVAIRTEIKFDPIKDNYSLNRRCIRQWGDKIENVQIDNKRAVFTEDMRTYLQSFYMDANRDIVQDLRNRKSYFGRVTSDYVLSQETIEEIEEKLSDANAKIIESIPSLRQTKKRIAAIGNTIGSPDSNVQIEPLARKISDLNKGMDIIMQDENAAPFSMAQQGYGTRSWISFLTLSAFVENQSGKLEDDDDAEQFIMLTMEEPEAHLHPQAQRQLFDQISHFKGQKVISTHAPSIVAQCSLEDVIYFKKQDGKTTATRYRGNVTNGGEEESIFREVLNTRAELLFASAVILCEGITEELALPVFFANYFGCAPYSLGINIINTGGQKYKPYLSLIRDFEIPWFIFSDGEEKTIKTVNAVVRDVFGFGVEGLSNVVILENDDDYEKYLIKEGYASLIIEAICEHEEDESFFENYINRMNGKKRKGGFIRNYTDAAGRESALIDLCHENKTDYALPVAKKIVEKAESFKKVPSKIEMLFSELKNKIRIFKN